MKIPGRISWAADLLGVHRGSRLLEIGCGRGIAARVLTPSLGANGYVGIDRSNVAIQAARKLNAEAEGRGIARFMLGALGEADVGGRLFDDILAVNVNAFWTDGGETAAKARPLLKSRGRMLLVYELPSSTRVGNVMHELEQSLRSGGFLMLNTVKSPDPRKAWCAIWARKG